LPTPPLLFILVRPYNYAMSFLQSLELLSHHANLLIGSDDVKTELISILENKYKIKSRGNPDFYDRKFESFTIDDARELKLQAIMRPVGEPSELKSWIRNGRKIFVLQMSAITVEAQNALLKLLEEPPEYAVFFLIIPSAHLLLPTVRSRLAIVEVKSALQSEAAADSMKDADLFLKAAPAKRLEMVKSLMDSIAKDKKTKQNAVDLLNSIEEIVHGSGVRNNENALEAIETARKYMNDRSPSLKMLLEYVALNV